MPTHEELPRFRQDWDRLAPEQQVLFMAAVLEMVEDLSDRGRLRPSRRSAAVAGHAGVFELSWSRDGRATFQYAAATPAGDTHMIWRRVGSHAILDDP